MIRGTHRRRRGAGVRALAAFELRRMLRSPATLAACAAFTAALALGRWTGRGGTVQAGDDRLFGHAFLLAAMIGWRLNLAADRARGFEAYVVANLVRPAVYLVGKLAAAAVWLGGLAAFAFVMGVALSAGDVRYAGWYAPVLALVVWNFVPALVVVELVVDTTVPAVVVALLFTVAATGSAAFGSVEAPFRLLGVLSVERYRPETLGPLVLRALVVVPALLAAVAALFHARAARRSRWRVWTTDESST